MVLDAAAQIRTGPQQSCRRLMQPTCVAIGEALSARWARGERNIQAQLMVQPFAHCVRPALHHASDLRSFLMHLNVEVHDLPSSCLDRMRILLAQLPECAIARIWAT